MALPPVNKQKYGDIKALQDIRLKVTPGEPVPRIAPGPGRPQGSKDSYQRVVNEQSGTVVAPMPEPTGVEQPGMTKEQSFMLERAIQAQSSYDELQQMAAQPGASPVIKAMAASAGEIAYNLTMQARQGTPWFDSDLDGIPDNME